MTNINPGTPTAAIEIVLSEAELERMEQMSWRPYQQTVDSLITSHRALAARVAELEAGLRFYADPEHWGSDGQATRQAWSHAQTTLNGDGMSDITEHDVMVAIERLECFNPEATEIVCADCGNDDGTLVHYLTGLNGQGPWLTLCQSCRAARKASWDPADVFAIERATQREPRHDER